MVSTKVQLEQMSEYVEVDWGWLHCGVNESAVGTDFTVNDSLYAYV